MDKEEEVSPSLVVTLENIIEDLQEKIGELEQEVADLQNQLDEFNVTN
jgi:uncharacterized protein YlxW (UPF0749 family)